MFLKLASLKSELQKFSSSVATLPDNVFAQMWLSCTKSSRLWLWQKESARLCKPSGEFFCIRTQMVPLETSMLSVLKRSVRKGGGRRSFRDLGLMILPHKHYSRILTPLIHPASDGAHRGFLFKGCFVQFVCIYIGSINSGVSEFGSFAKQVGLYVLQWIELYRVPCLQMMGARACGWPHLMQVLSRKRTPACLLGHIKISEWEIEYR